MTIAATPPPLILRGDGFARGEQQALSCQQQVPAVRLAVDKRLAALGPSLHSPAVSQLLAAQWQFAEHNDTAGLAETQGIAAGFGLSAETLFAYLHANIITDMAAGLPANPPGKEGCTSWAAGRRPANGAWVVKNRDYRGEHGALQRVMFHADPQWGRRSMLCLGSLGSPGAFSSGINSDGLAVVDTQIDTCDHGVGWLRYFLMSHLLRSCGSVAQALARIAAVPHAGGGSLVLGDASGAVASVELGHAAQAIESPGADWTARTNHFTQSGTMSGSMSRGGDAALRCSQDRLARVETALRQHNGDIDLATIQTLMAGHDHAGKSGPCRHPDGDGSRTLSSAIYQTRIPSLVMSDGAPCLGRWHTYAVSDAFG